MSNELVKRLEDTKRRMLDDGRSVNGPTILSLTDAITFISSQDSVRDRALDLDAACRAHHAVRSIQGFTTAAWDKLEERNREQYREAMRAALKTTSLERGTVEDRCPICGMNEGCSHTLAERKRATQPAQEAPQSLEQWVDGHLFGRDHNDCRKGDLRRFAAELDRRQGAK